MHPHPPTQRLASLRLAIDGALDAEKCAGLALVGREGALPSHVAGRVILRAFLLVVFLLHHVCALGSSWICVPSA